MTVSHEQEIKAALAHSGTPYAKIGTANKGADTRLYYKHKKEKTVSVILRPVNEAEYKRLSVIGRAKLVRNGLPDAIAAMIAAWLDFRAIGVGK